MSIAEHPLSPDEFALALRKGQGRAARYAARHGISAVREQLLEACLQDLKYDPQCEPGRADWLYVMFAGTDYYQHVRAGILAGLQCETDTWNLQQLFELALEMARRGDLDARAGIRARALAVATDHGEADWMGVKEWLELGGLEALLELVRVYGRRLLADPEVWVPEHALVWNETGLALKDQLVPYVAREPEVRAYWDHISAWLAESEQGRLSRAQEQGPDQRKSFWQDRGYTLQRILRAARKHQGEIPGRFTQFGRIAEPDELAKVYGRLLLADSIGERMRLLWVFRAVPTPELAESLFDWARGRHNGLREAAIAALAMHRHPHIHALCRDHLRAGRITGDDTSVLALLDLNYSSGDAELLQRALAGLSPDREDAHHLSLGLLKLAGLHQDPALAPALDWACEHTPCSDCRFSLLKQLGQWNRVEASLLAECQYDAHPEIRAWALVATQGDSALV